MIATLVMRVDQFKRQSLEITKYESVGDVETASRPLDDNNWFGL
jgi:hypothetical protein